MIKILFGEEEEQAMPLKKMKEETELFYSYLRQNGLKKTYQKDLILDTFLNTEGHLSVEDIYGLVKKRDRKVGIVTVFRTLKSLTACGIAKEIILGDGLTRFEHNYHHPQHHHIVCSECHKAIEFVCPELDRIQSEILEKYRFKLMYHRFQTYGICEDCLERRPVTEIQKHDTERIFARDAVKMALSMERRCLEFYRNAALRNRDPGGTKVFEWMVREKETHMETLHATLDEIVGQEEGLDKAPVFLHFNPRELESLIQDCAMPKTDCDWNLDAHSAAELTLSLNQSSAGFFKEYADKFNETQGRRILLNFASQEESHNKVVQQRLNDLLGESKSP
jgi:Fur family ferric uptake transcriptional regulator